MPYDAHYVDRTAVGECIPIGGVAGLTADLHRSILPQARLDAW
jgi:hypothetical protein